jgi:DsbC/DsbD-like thiol-disulfide interchange protein
VLRLAACLLLGACGGAAPPAADPAVAPAPAAGPPSAAELVKVSLLAGATRVAPGGEVELGVRFAIAPGWHIYWTNPGESGLATEVSVTAPDGFDVGPVRFPAPRSFPDETGVTYGYEDETVLFVSARAPASLAGAATFTAKASFLACREACLKGEAQAALELPVGEGEPANRPLFAPHAERLPGPPLAGVASRWEEEPEARVLVVSVPDATAVELFPNPEQPALVLGQTSAASMARIRFQRVERPAVIAVTGVLRVERAGRSQYHLYERSWNP